MLAYSFVSLFCPSLFSVEEFFFEGICLENDGHSCALMCVVCLLCLWFVDNLCVGGEVMMTVATDHILLHPTVSFHSV